MKKPKRPGSAYNLFFKSDEYKRIVDKFKDQNPAASIDDAFRIGSALAAKAWRELDPSVKRKFEKKAAQMKIEYLWNLARFIEVNSKDVRKKRTRKSKSLSAFQLFCKERRAALSNSNPEYTFGELSKRCGKEWTDMLQEVKVNWEELAEQTKLAYAQQEIE